MLMQNKVQNFREKFKSQYLLVFEFELEMYLKDLPIWGYGC